MYLVKRQHLVSPMHHYPAPWYQWRPLLNRPDWSAAVAQVCRRSCVSVACDCPSQQKTGRWTATERHWTLVTWCQQPEAHRPLQGNIYTHTLLHLLTLSTSAVPNCCCSKGSAPYWSNPPFLIFDIRALWRSVLSARSPECQKLKMVG